MATIDPYQNETESISFGDLTVENRTDRITIHGDLDITRDKAGLEKARTLQALMAKIVASLEAEADALPDEIEIIQTTTVRNPFE